MCVARGEPKNLNARRNSCSRLQRLKVRQNAGNVGRVNEQPGRRRRQNNPAGNAPALTLFIGRPNVAGENLTGRVPRAGYQSLRRCL